VSTSQAAVIICSLTALHARLGSLGLHAVNEPMLLCFAKLKLGAQKKRTKT
jgi:hypothetical protein